MPQTDFGPVNITQGNSAQFVLEFTSTSGTITTPSSASLTVTYTNTSGATQTDTVSLSVSGSYWIGTWSSTSASYGLANWTVTSGSTVTSQQGVIRVIDP